MDGKYLENVDKNYQKVYNSVVVDPSKINILSNKLTRDIVKLLSENRLCAMDLSRELKQHEQKIYYHMRKLEEAGIVKQVGTEKRFGMIAKMYSAQAPIVCTKLYDEGQMIESKETADPLLAKFFSPFVENGKLNSLIIVGDARPHGKYDKANTGAMHTIDIVLLLGKLVRDFKTPTYKIDTEVEEKDLQQNLILFGSPRDNMILEKINQKLPLKFVLEADWSIKSKSTNSIYTGSRKGVLIRCENPFNEKKKILVFGGLRTEGLRSPVVAVLKNLEEIWNLNKNGDLYVVLDGLDKDGDGVVDTAKILE